MFWVLLYVLLLSSVCLLFWCFLFGWLVWFWWRILDGRVRGDFFVWLLGFFFQDTPPYVALAGLKLKRSSRLSLPTVMAKGVRNHTQPHNTFWRIKEKYCLGEQRGGEMLFWALCCKAELFLYFPLETLCIQDIFAYFLLKTLWSQGSFVCCLFVLRQGLTTL